jgi:hypothetical protein
MSRVLESQALSSLILLNLTGGECVEGLAKLQGDEGFPLILHRMENFGLPMKGGWQIAPVKTGRMQEVQVLYNLRSSEPS